MNTIVAMTNIIGRAHTIKNAEKRMSKILFWYLNETTGNQFYITIQLEKLIKALLSMLNQKKLGAPQFGQ